MRGHTTPSPAALPPLAGFFIVLPRSLGWRRISAALSLWGRFLPISFWLAPSVSGGVFPFGIETPMAAAAFFGPSCPILASPGNWRGFSFGVENPRVHLARSLRRETGGDASSAARHSSNRQGGRCARHIEDDWDLPRPAHGHPAILSISEKELHSIARADRGPRCCVNRRLGPFHAHWAGVCTLPRYTTPQRPTVWCRQVVSSEGSAFAAGLDRRSSTVSERIPSLQPALGRRSAPTVLRKLPVSGYPAPRMLCEVEYLPGIFVRRLAECFAVILYPIATMLLVNGHCEQSNLIPIVLNQSRPKGLTITPDEAVRLLMCEGRSNAGHSTHSRAEDHVPQLPPYRW